MGTWGVGIFQDDFAGDVRAAFEDEIAAGANSSTAAKRVLLSFADSLDDTDEEPVLYLALASLQLNLGVVNQEIRKRVLEIIDNGEGLDGWEEADPQNLIKRKEVLNGLRARLSQ